jgi:hypothetical protein
MKYGWKAVPRNPDVLLKGIDGANSKEYSVDDLQFPDSKIVQATLQFAKNRLPVETFNHSQRVYVYGMPLSSLFALTTIEAANARPQVRRSSSLTSHLGTLILKHTTSLV